MGPNGKKKKKHAANPNRSKNRNKSLCSLISLRDDFLSGSYVLTIRAAWSRHIWAFGNIHGKTPAVATQRNDQASVVSLCFTYFNLRAVRNLRNRCQLVAMFPYVVSLVALKKKNVPVGSLPLPIYCLVKSPTIINQQGFLNRADEKINLMIDDWWL